MMIVIKYTGGLGNQMFIYAMQIVLKQKFPQEEILADLSRYSYSNEHDGFDIVKYFQIDIQEIDKDIKKKVTPFNYMYTRLQINKLFQKFSVCGFERLDEFFEKKNEDIGIISVSPYIYDKDVFYINFEKKIWHYKGNWINPFYWKGYEDNIYNSLKFRTEFISKDDEWLLQDMKNSNSVAMHIRQGDYKGDYRFDLCTKQYYIQALDYLAGVFGGRKNLKLYVFSDDANLKLDYIKDIDYRIIYHLDKSGIDLYMMSKCKHNIIVNSTFSYWSALLNENKEKIVIAPLYVYRGNSFYREMPVPRNWVKINNIQEGVYK